MKKKDGFPGQQSYVIPEPILNLTRNNPLCNELYLTDIGYYPKALHHFRERNEGIAQFILIYNIGGSGIITIAGNEIILPSDHFLFIPEGVPHSYKADISDPWSIYWLHFSGTKAKLIAKPTIEAVNIMRTTQSRINERLSLFSEIFHNLERGYSIETLEYVNLCLPRLLATFTHIAHYRSFNEQLTKDPVSQSINYMLENINRKLKLIEIAKAIKLSSSHYSRLFLNRTGHSPIDYFIQLKIQRSCRLLDNSDLSISDIAREIGFDDQFYFSRQFRKVMNMSPTQYRKR